MDKVEGMNVRTSPNTQSLRIDTVNEGKKLTERSGIMYPQNQFKLFIGPLILV